MTNPETIVGVDGSAGSHAALRWAATEAVRRECELVVVNVYEWRVVGVRVQVSGAIAADARTHAEEVVATAVAYARSLEPRVRVRGEVVQGSPSSALIGASATADLVVVGSRGHGGFASLLLGSVGQQVATHATGPVVVVRGRPGVTGGPIVVGVDSSTSAGHAVGVAFSEAETRGSGVVAIRAFVVEDPPLGSRTPLRRADREQRQEAELGLLLDEVAPWKEKYPEVAVECVALEGHAGEVLVGLSSTAQLVVVGTSGHGSIAGSLPGSVVLRLLHRADCPVFIAR